ncbi:DUF2213 domain-containing protein [Enterobacter roggenkampii]|uniref:DUF2213 domain-containing protein n=1 Tax=Enterobacter roggenkampii TaxID=1812935 RepID=UPI00207551F6|nr:DUF2213 domain-containing protein [Enterobacter roggenkampii]MCM7078323.1 DUF2213 domain-containing protein [Enterobacter roggenkampii]
MKYFFTTRLGETRYQLADGSLLCKDVPIARTGTQQYLSEELNQDDLIPDANGLITAYRTEDEVFSPETMASFEGMAVTLDHPEDGEGNIVFVNPANFAELAHGHIQNVRRGTGDKADLLIADVLVKRQEGIDAINAGKNQVSCGYDAKYIPAGVGKAKQTEITGNHLAIVDKGRAGSRCAIGDSAPSKPKEKPAMSWLKKVAQAIKTKDEDAFNKLIDEAPDMPSDGMGSIPGVTINMNVPSQATALPTDQKTTVDEDSDPDDDKKTGDEEVPAWAQAIIARLDKLEGKTGDSDLDDDKPTCDEDAEEDAKVTGDAAYKRNIIGDAEIICPGFQPTSDKGLKRQVLAHAARTGDSLKAFGISDFDKAPKATIDAVFKAAVEISKAKNHITPPSGKPTGDRARGPMSPAELNKINAEFWKRNQ